MLAVQEVLEIKLRNTEIGMKTTEDHVKLQAQLQVLEEVYDSIINP